MADNHHVNHSETEVLDEDFNADDLLERARDLITTQVEHNPLRALGIAAGVGYVLGRGIPSFLVKIGLVAATRMATDALVAATVASLGHATSDDPPTPTTPRRRRRDRNKQRVNGTQEQL